METELYPDNYNLDQVDESHIRLAKAAFSETAKLFTFKKLSVNT